MPYIARTRALPEPALRGGLVDPRADHQTTFGKRMACRDVSDFLSNTTELSPLELRHHKVGAGHTSSNVWRREPASECQAKLDKILTRSNEIRLPSAAKVEESGYRPVDQPLSDLVPGLVVSGGLSRSSPIGLTAPTRFRQKTLPPRFV